MKYKILFLILFGFINSSAQVKDSVITDSINGINSQIIFKQIIKKNKKFVRITSEKIENEKSDTINIPIPKGDTTTKFILEDLNFKKYIADTNFFKDSNILVAKLKSLSLKSLTNYKFYPKITLTEPPPPPPPPVPTIFEQLINFIVNNPITIILSFLNLIFIFLFIIYIIKFKKLKDNYFLLTDAQKVNKLFKNYNLRFKNNSLKDNIDEIYKQYILVSDGSKVKDSHLEDLKKQIFNIQNQNDKLGLTIKDIVEKLEISEKNKKENLDNINSLESTIESLKIEFDLEKKSQIDVQNISSLLLKKFNHKSSEIQELTSQESLDEAKKSFIKALIFMTFQSRSLIKKINKSATKPDIMNTDLLLDKPIKANKIISSNVQYNEVDHLVYVTLKLFKDYKITDIDDVFFNGDAINDKL